MRYDRCMILRGMTFGLFALVAGSQVSIFHTCPIRNCDRAKLSLGPGNTNQSGKMLDADDERPELILQSGHSYKPDAMAFSPDGRLIATGGSDTAIKIWDAATGRVLRTLNGHVGGVKAVAFSPDGQRLGSGGNDGRIRFWEIASGVEADVTPGNANALTFSRDGRWVAAGGA